MPLADNGGFWAISVGPATGESRPVARRDIGALCQPVVMDSLVSTAAPLRSRALQWGHTQFSAVDKFDTVAQQAR